MTVFFQLTSSTDKAAGLFSVCAAFDDRVFIVDLTRLARIPTMPLAYWVSERVLELFDREAKGQVIPREAKNGLGTMGDFRFVRLTEEVEGDGQSSWPDFCKGGRRSHFFQEVRTAVNWAADGAAVKAHVVHRYGGGHWSRNVRSVSHYRQPGLTWPLRGSAFLGSGGAAGRHLQRGWQDDVRTFGGRSAPAAWSLQFEGVRQPGPLVRREAHRCAI